MKISLFEKAVIILEKNGALPTVYKPHLLHGNYSGLMECHISPDWLLIYRVKPEEKEIDLIRMGSHSDLF